MDAGAVPPVTVEGVVMCEWEEPGCFGVLAGEGVMETVGMGGERGMEVGEVDAVECGPRGAGATPVGAVFSTAAPPEERLRPTACNMLRYMYMYSVRELHV